ncbi:DUF2062 domain-containing protein [Falsirhodobacter sp. alg1]|uniref:DUF2062 domain-containing protein n=1 Tax=Falsirhodobacter sp. alg1 TaxID=1472418 RepID=UPI0007889D81|nr:DUF2062 domain-containing protein [Falsirhodobacter sp. alg1]
MFKRRETFTFWQKLGRTLWPRSGWRRAVQYLWHRVVRLPDDPRRVARGVACGVFAAFGPYLFHDYIIAAALAWVIRGNIFAAIIAAFVQNPLTLPFLAVSGVGLGQYLLGMGEGLPSWQIVAFFAKAAGELLHNFFAIFTDADMRWLSLQLFFQRIYLPYLLGGSILGLAAAIGAYTLVLSLVRAYRGLRITRLRARSETLARAAAQKDNGG